MKMKTILYALLLIWGVSYAQDQGWKTEDVVNQERVSDVDIAPGGKAVVWVKSRPDKKQDKFVSDLWLTLLDQKDKKGNPRQIQLTRGKESDRSPLFSADGETIYFLSSRAKGKAIWAMSTFGGEPYAVDSFETSISDLKWLNDSTLTFTAEEGKTLYELENEKKKDNTVVVEDEEHFKASRVFAFHVKDKTTRRLTHNEFPVSEYAVSKDGKWIVTRHTMSPHYGVDGNPDPTYYLWNLEAKTSTQILKEGYQTPGNFAFSEDSKGFYFGSVQSSDPEWEGAGITLLYYFDLDSQSAEQIDIDWDWGLSRGYEVIGNDVLITLAQGATMGLAYLKKSGDSWDKISFSAGDMTDHINPVEISKEYDQLVYTYSTASQPVKYLLSDLQIGNNEVSLSEKNEIATVNEHLKEKPLTQSEVVTWMGALDDEINGILYYPLNYEKGRAYPLIVSIHGGPSGVDMDTWSDRWSTYPHLLAEKGAFVLKPNYHGSGNHGQEFVESIKGHYYEYELPDVLSGIQMLVDKGMVDEDSLGVMGWSNGAIISTMLTVRHPDKFKVCAAGAGDVNWTSDYGTCRFGVTFDQSYFGGAPWDNTNGKTYNEAYLELSPLFEMEKVKTPTIIFHGSEDRAVPRDQGWEYYRALQQLDQAPVRFLWFPGQRHGLAKLTHQLRKMNEEIAWIDKHLFGKVPDNNEAVKEDSPLMSLLEKEKSAHQDGVMGEMVKGKLIPEVVVIKEDSIALSKFELTNAQYKAYNEDHQYSALHANHPVIGLSFAEAKAYVSWLSEMTGENYRLPIESEGKALHKQAVKAAKDENSIHYWAGYDITMDDVKEFKEKLSSVDATLIKPVGSFKPVKIGAGKIYDLGGNVSEWYEVRGAGKIMGFSAYDYADEHEPTADRSQQYVGVRVVKVLK